MHPAQAQAVLAMIDGLSQQLTILRNVVGQAVAPQPGSQQAHQQRQRQQQARQAQQEQQTFTTPEEDHALDEALMPPPQEFEYLSQPQAPQQQYAQPAQFRQAPQGQGFAQFQGQRQPPQQPYQPQNQADFTRMFEQAQQQANGAATDVPPYLTQG